MTEDEIEQLEDVISIEIGFYLTTAAEDQQNRLWQLQPTDLIVKQAARAAAQVMLAYARGCCGSSAGNGKSPTPHDSDALI
jgi:hypothetical protein